MMTETRVFNTYHVSDVIVMDYGTLLVLALVSRYMEFKIYYLRILRLTGHVEEWLTNQLTNEITN
jgi:hypothetical protein